MLRGLTFGSTKDKIGKWQWQWQWMVDEVDEVDGGQMKASPVWELHKQIWR